MTNCNLFIYKLLTVKHLRKKSPKRAIFGAGADKGLKTPVTVTFLPCSTYEKETTKIASN